MEIMKNLTSNKSYFGVKFPEHKEIFNGVLSVENDTYQVPESILESICKYSGVSPNMSRILRNSDSDAWMKTVLSLYKHYYKDDEFYFLVSNGCIQEVTFKNKRPLLNVEFLKETSSTISDYEESIQIKDYSYSEDSYISEVLLFNKKEYEYQGKSYELGVLLVNDELSKVSCTLAIKYDELVFYLPSKYLSLSSSRYMKSAEDSLEAYRLLLLKVVEGLLSDTWSSIISEIDIHLSNCAKIPATYEEYRRFYRLLKRASILSEMSEEETEEILDRFKEDFFDFEENYPMLEDKSGSYIWRCSALSDNSVHHLIFSLKDILSSNVFEPSALYELRHALGDLLTLSKISTELAKKGR